MGKNLSESLLGAGVLVGAVIFLLFAYSKSGLKKFDGYEVSAKFDRIDGLAEGSDVKMSGIKIGSVIEQELDGTTYLANLKLIPSASNSINLYDIIFKYVAPISIFYLLLKEYY